LILTQNQ